ASATTTRLLIIRRKFDVRSVESLVSAGDGNLSIHLLSMTAGPEHQHRRKSESVNEQPDRETKSQQTCSPPGTAVALECAGYEGSRALTKFARCLANFISESRDHTRMLERRHKRSVI